MAVPVEHLLDPVASRDYYFLFLSQPQTVYSRQSHYPYPIDRAILNYSSCS